MQKVLFQIKWETLPANFCYLQIGCELWMPRLRLIIVQELLTLFSFLFLAVKIYLEYLKTPYFIFLRDTLSYLALVGLHFAFCLSPSSRAFSGLEWSILAFFTGRLLVEFEQIRLINKRIKGRREREKDKTNSNVVQKTLSSYIRWIIISLRAPAWEHWESRDSDYFGTLRIFCLKIPFGELFSTIIILSSSVYFIFETHFESLKIRLKCVFRPKKCPE